MRSEYSYAPDGSIVEVRTRATHGQDLDPQTKITRYEYQEPERVFPSRIVDPNGGEQRYVYDQVFGAPLAIATTGGTLQWARIDGFGAVRSAGAVGGDSATITGTSCQQIGCVDETLSFMVDISTASGQAIEQDYDFKGRIRRSSALQDDYLHTQRLSTEVTYDEFGRVLRTGIDTHEGGVQWYRRAYDKRDRLLLREGRDGTTTWSYGANSATQKDANNRFTTSVFGADGALLALINHQNKPVRYLNGPNGRPWFIADSLGTDTGGTQSAPNLTSFDYDQFGRPAAVHDSSAGEEAYEYDGFGNVLSATNALATTSFDYDILDRVIARDTALGADVYAWDVGSGAGYGKPATALKLNLSTSAASCFRRFAASRASYCK